MPSNGVVDSLTSLNPLYSIAASDTQFANDKSPIAVTDSGIIIDARLEHP